MGMLWGLAWAGSVARAQPTHYQAILVGDRSSGLGTAFTGLANDGSAVYYNPAGMVSQERATLTGGLILNAYDRIEIVDGVHTSFGDFGISDRSKPSFPAFASSALRLGRRDEDGQRPYVFAFSSFRLGNDGRNTFVQMPNPSTGLTDTLEETSTYRNTYYGLSFAQRFGRRWSGGVSLFLSQVNSRYFQQLFSVTGPDPFDIDQSTEASVTYDLRVKAFYGVLRLGALFQPSERWQLGIMLQPPGFRFKARANVRRQAERYDLSVDPPEGLYAFDKSGTNARVPVPAEIRVGVAERVGPRVLLTQDLSFVMPIRDQSVFTLDPVVPGATGTILYPGSTQRTFVCNAALGLQYSPTRYMMLDFGAFTDFSSAPRVEATSSTYQAARIERFGFSGSVVLHNQRHGLAIGLVGVLGRGHAQALDLTADLLAGDPLFFSQPARERTVYLSVTGATQVIEDLSNAAVERFTPDLGGSGGSSSLRMPWRVVGDPDDPAYAGGERLSGAVGGEGTQDVPAEGGARVWDAAAEAPAPDAAPDAAAEAPAPDAASDAAPATAP